MANVDALLKQHQQIRSLLAQVRADLQRGDLEGVRDGVHALGVTLVVHLAEEDGQLYPEIVARGRASERERLGLLCRSFQTSMEPISQALSRFCARFESPTSNLKGFEGAFDGFAQLLLARLATEEVSLYPLLAPRPAATERAATK